MVSDEKIRQGIQRRSGQAFSEIGIKKSGEQLGIPYYSLAEWRQKRKAYGKRAYVSSGVRRNEAQGTVEFDGDEG